MQFETNRHFVRIRLLIIVYLCSTAHGSALVRKQVQMMESGDFACDLS